MEIAKGISNRDYQKLELSDPMSKDWEKAAEIFEKRFCYRYIEPVDQLLKAEENLSAKDKKYGFAVIAIDCLLIETLACFYNGFITTPSRQNSAVYAGFLTNPETELSRYFDKTTAPLFYNEVRCGVLHQSETKNNALIKARGPLVRLENGSVVINRIKLHEVLKKEFDHYIQKVKDPSNTMLRSNFKKKMDHICR